MVDLWRTAQAVAAAPSPAEIKGSTDLLGHYGLDQIAPIAAKSLHVDYTDPEHVKLFDPLGKLKGPPECKQLFRQPVPECRWDLLPVTRWPEHTYNFHPYPMDSIQRALQLQPGPSAIAEGDLGVQVGPDRVQLATPPPTIVTSHHVPGYSAFQDQPTVTEGGRPRRKRARKAADVTYTESIASENTGDTTTHDVTSTRRRQRADR